MESANGALQVWVRWTGSQGRVWRGCKSYGAGGKDARRLASVLCTVEVARVWGWRGGGGDTGGTKHN